MRAVILGLSALVFVSSAQAGSLQSQDTVVFAPKSDSKDLGLPSFTDGAQGGTLGFNSIGQTGSVQMFDLGGKNTRQKNADIFQELQMDLSGAKRASGEPTQPAE